MKFDKKFALLQSIVLGTVFGLTFTSFNAFMMIITHIYQQQGLNGIGPVILALNYFGFIIGNIIAPSCKWTYKYQMTVSAFCYSLNSSTGIYLPYIQKVILKYFVAGLATFISGYSGGFLWVSQGAFIHQLMEKCQIAIDKRGKYFSIFITGYSFSGPLAGLMATFGFGFFSAQIFFIIISINSCLAGLFCYFFLENFNRNFSQSFYLLKNLKNILKFYPKMYSMIAFLLVDGFCLMVYSSQIPRFIKICYPTQNIDKLVGISTICIGIGTVLSGISISLTTTKIKSYQSGWIGLHSFLVTAAVTSLSIYLTNYYLVCISAFLWGFTLIYIEGWAIFACSYFFGGYNEAFSINKQLHSLFYIIFQIIVIITGNNINLYGLIIAGVIFTIPAYYTLTKVRKRHQLQQKIFQSSQIQNTEQFNNKIHSFQNYFPQQQSKFHHVSKQRNKQFQIDNI